MCDDFQKKYFPGPCYAENHPPQKPKPSQFVNRLINKKYSHEDLKTPLNNKSLDLNNLLRNKTNEMPKETSLHKLLSTRVLDLKPSGEEA